jgi:hypothetical protein
MYDTNHKNWMTIDPLAEKYYHLSPYAFVNNNPMNVIDPDGRDGVYVNFPDYKISTPVGRIGGLPSACKCSQKAK